MKKNGFTLAEVLITLAIIGVVATMTLPTLMNNVGEQQARTAIRKVVRDLSQLGNRNQVDGTLYSAVVPFEGESGVDITSAEARTGDTLVAVLLNGLDVDLARATEDITPPDQFPALTTAIPLRDGSTIFIDPATDGRTAPASTLQEDGLPTGYTIVYDMNGRRGPNVLSNCRGNAAGDNDERTAEAVGDTPAVEAADEAACNDVQNRVIADRFQIQLRGRVAEPRGAAARFTYNH